MVSFKADSEDAFDEGGYLIDGRCASEGEIEGCGELQVLSCEGLFDNACDCVNISEVAALFAGTVYFDRAPSQGGVDESWNDGCVRAVRALTWPVDVEEPQSDVAHVVGRGVRQDE